MNGAQQLIRTLEHLGCRTIFGIPGIHNLDVYDALLESDIHHVTARNEAGAGFMADGFARATGEPGIALVISGPGLTNILTPMGEAMHDSIPMLVISSQIPASVMGQETGFLHELRNSTIMSASVAKESRMIPSADLIGPSIEEAYRLCRSGRPGPIHMEIPMDVLRESIVPEPDEETLSQAVRVLEDATGVVIIAGGGSLGAERQIRLLAERLGAPVVQSAAAKGVLDERHPLSLGTRIHFAPVREFVEAADAVLAVGTQLSPTDLWETPLRPRGRLIRIDTDSGAFRRNCPADIGLKGDAAAVLDALLARLDGSGDGDSGEDDRPGVSDRHRSTLKRVEEFRRSSREQVGAVTGVGEQLPLMLACLDAIRETLPENGLLFTDMTMPAYVALSEYPAYRGRTFFHPVGFGTLGFALPAALGAKQARPDLPVCALTGDGGFQFTMQELATACEENVSLPLLIWNNRGFGEIRRTEDERHPGRRIAVDNRNPDFIALADAYGIPGRRVGSAEHLAEALRDALASPSPFLIEITPDGGEHHE